MRQQNHRRGHARNLRHLDSQIFLDARRDRNLRYFFIALPQDPAERKTHTARCFRVRPSTLVDRQWHHVAPPVISFQVLEERVICDARLPNGAGAVIVPETGTLCFVGAEAFAESDRVPIVQMP